jgi:uncharacterized membrane protein
MRALANLSTIDWLALSAFLLCWAGYTWFSEHSRWCCKGLIGHLHSYRKDWAYHMLERDLRMTDAALIGNLMTSVSFYANTTIYIIAGLVAALGAADQLLSFSADLTLGGSQQPRTARNQADPGSRQLRLRLLQVHLGAAPVQCIVDPHRRGANGPARRAESRRFRTPCGRRP